MVCGLPVGHLSGPTNAQGGPVSEQRRLHTESIEGPAREQAAGRTRDSIP